MPVTTKSIQNYCVDGPSSVVGVVSAPQHNQHKLIQNNINLAPKKAEKSSSTATAKTKDKTTLKKQAEEVHNLKLRVYLKPNQHHKSNNWIYFAQKFRNMAVDFITRRRIERAIWLKDNTNLNSPTKPTIPEELSGHDADACSRWLTILLEQARLDATQYLDIHATKREFAAALSKRSRLQSISENRDDQELVPHLFLLTLPRTVLDQVIQDLKKTIDRAISDRVKKLKKPAGFPQTKKLKYPGSLRFQIARNHQQATQHWSAGLLFIPGLGELSFRDEKSLPETMPTLITLSRNAADQWHATFVDADTTAKNTASSKTWGVLPVESVNGFNRPTCDAFDLGLADRATDTDGKTLGRQRFLKRFEKKCRRLSKSLSRKKHGSGHWKKTKKKHGALQVQIANQRSEGLKDEARYIVQQNAIVCMEDLNLAFMLQNKHLSSSAHDASLGKLKQLVAWECQKRGHLLIECGRFDASSKTCSNCKLVNKELTLKDRSWTCPGCNTCHDREQNAAINIRIMALTVAVNRLVSQSSPQKAVDLLLHSDQAVGGQKSTNSPTEHISQAPGNDVRMISSHKLHPELESFIVRGGLTSLLELHCSRESQAVEACILPSKRHFFSEWNTEKMAR